ncbi:MAG: tetratricopeptide repeat protein [Clostridia bacterium]|nr:tetratricopeptide repeat protein [Clostridia bacterium]
MHTFLLTLVLILGVMSFITPIYGESTPLFDQIQAVAKNIDNAPTESVAELESLLEEATAMGDTKSIIEANVNIGLGYLKLDQYERTMQHFQESYALSLEYDYPSLAGHSKNGYGMVWLTLNDYTKALQSFQQSLEYFETANDQQGMAYATGNLGAVYDALGNYDLALENYLNAARINEELGNKEEMASNYNNIGTIHSSQNDFETAFDYYTKAITIFEEIESKEGQAYTYTNLGHFFSHYNYQDEAYGFYLKALRLNIELDDKVNLADSFNNIARIFEIKENYEDAAEYYTNALGIYQELDNLKGAINVTNNLGTIEYKKYNFERALELHNSAFEASKALQYNEGLESAIFNLSMDYEALGETSKAIDFKSLYIELQKVIFSEDQSENIANAQIVYETEKKDAEIEQKAQELKDQAARMRRQLIVLGVAGAIIVLVSILGYIIYKERQKSEKLLLNILPKKVANDLKVYGKTEPENFENCSVYFSDIVSFTSTSENLEPKYLIEELSDIFTTFDGIMDKYGCERIKTIGDAYMAVSGMPVPAEHHAENMIDAALDILDALKARGEQAEINWRIRIGINSGKIVGGVVGVKKYLYDVFGDTINTASRMESNSEPMRLNISPSTYAIVKDRTDKYTFTERAAIEVKGKGLLKMYFVDRA